eukprot:gb/GECG01003899.1/.p1 GENE.gb/GECG01003899.1/~~gb/GECG01003899.1/.p1  ORF type:complete len:281 (+),score=33.19 gb/GECG01003899.1/:1-843(+)
MNVNELLESHSSSLRLFIHVVLYALRPQCLIHTYILISIFILCWHWLLNVFGIDNRRGKKGTIMSRPVSLSGKPKQGPKHQNTTAFRHNKNSKKSEWIMSIPLTNVCDRCRDQLQWRKNYRKYKPLTQPKRCRRCNERNVKQAYHIICRDCVLKYKCCGKCLDKLDPSQLEGGEGQEQAQEGYSLEDLLERKPPGMKERERRRLIRELSEKDGGDKSNDDDKESIDEDWSDDDEEGETFDYRTRLDNLQHEEGENSRAPQSASAGASSGEAEVEVAANTS